MLMMMMMMIVIHARRLHTNAVESAGNFVRGACV
jgi:hypothetical protein